MEKQFLNESAVKYPIILSLFKSVASLSHGNAAPGNGFSINKHLIGIHGTSIQPDTIEGLRIVKDTILKFGSIFFVPITRSLLDSVKLAKQRYDAYLENKRKLKEAEKESMRKQEEKKEQQEEKKKGQDENAEIKSKLQQVSNGLTVADDIAKEGNDELKQCLLQKTSTRKDLQRAQSKIEIGMKRRQELMIEQEG